MLIVDDDDLARHALAEFLRQAGVEVICAATPMEALHARECAVIVSELRLTGQSVQEGQELLAELRNRRPSSEVVIFSSFISTAQAAESTNAAAALPKSTPLRDVAAVIKALLARSPAPAGAEGASPR